MALKLSQLRDVIAVADQGSLRGAARALQLTQPALTRSIHAIERELGVALFERGRSGVQLTAAGEAFLRRARSVQVELQRASDEAAQINGALRGQIAVAMSAAAIFSLLPAAIGRFRDRFDMASIAITEGFFRAIEPALASGSFDFYVGPCGELKRPRFVVEKLFDNHRVIVARRQHPLAGSTTLAALSNAEWVKQTLDSSGGEGDFEVVFDELGLPRPRIAMFTSSATATLLAISSSDLLTMSPRLMLGAPIDTSLFTVLPVIERLSAAPICIVQRAQMPLSPLAQQFCDLIRRAAVLHLHQQNALV